MRRCAVGLIAVLFLGPGLGSAHAQAGGASSAATPPAPTTPTKASAVASPHPTPVSGAPASVAPAQPVAPGPASAAAAPAPTSAAPVPAAPAAASAADHDFLRGDRPTLGPGVSIDGERGDPAEPDSLGWTLAKLFITLGVVILLVYLTLNVGLRKLMGIAPAGRRASVVQVIERLSIDPKKTLLVVKAAGEYLLLGGAEGSLTLISKLDPVEVERIDATRQAASPPVALSPFLQKLLSRRGGPQPPTA